ncbi:MAG: hypothetical protein HY574_08675 [candidate division NC10 bacterium]|nr:hypothetical protein [candidate division NC10 bacterium]
MRIALHDLRLDHLTVLYPGKASYPLADRVTAMPLTVLVEGGPEVLFRHRRRKGRLTPPKERQRLGSGDTLLRAAQEVGKPEIGGTRPHSISRDHNRHLYGRKLK